MKQCINLIAILYHIITMNVFSSLVDQGRCFHKITLVG
jgi:hypothetical protein